MIWRISAKINKIRKELLEENPEAAAALCDELDISKIKESHEIAVIADAYFCNKEYLKAKQCYEQIYKKKVTEDVVSRLAHICVKLKDAAEAKRYTDELLELDSDDFYIYIYKYNIAKMEGKPLEERISLLEKLKSMEYIEEWAYELAKLYHKTEQKEKCIEECKNIVIWFGEGEYVEKAKALKAYYEGKLDITLAGSNSTEFLKEIKSVIGRNSNVNNIPVQSRKLIDNEKTNPNFISDFFKLSDDTKEHSDEVNIDEENLLEKVHSEISDISKFKEPIEMNNNYDENIIGNEDSKGYENVSESISNDKYDGISENINTNENINEYESINKDTNEYEKLKDEDKKAADDDIDFEAYEKAVLNESTRLMDMFAKEENARLNTKEEDNKKTETDALTENDDSAQDDILTENNDLAQDDILTSNSTVKKITLIPNDNEEEGNVLIKNASKDNTSLINNNTIDKVENQDIYERESVKLIDYKSENNNNKVYRVIEFKNCDNLKTGINQYGELFKKLEAYNINFSEIFGGFVRAEGIKEKIIKVFENVFLDGVMGNAIVVTDADENSGTALLMAKRTARLFQQLGYIDKGKTALIDLSKNTSVNFLEKQKQLSGCCIIVENAGSMNKESLDSLINLKHKLGNELFIIIVDYDVKMAGLFEDREELLEDFYYFIEIPVLKVDEWKELAYDVIIKNSYELTREADVALSEKIIQFINSAISWKILSDYLKGVIEKCNRKNKEILYNMNDSGRFENLKLMVLERIDF